MFIFVTSNPSIRQHIYSKKNSFIICINVYIFRELKEAIFLIVSLDAKARTRRREVDGVFNLSKVVHDFVVKERLKLGTRHFV